MGVKINSAGSIFNGDDIRLLKDQLKFKTNGEQIITTKSDADIEAGVAAVTGSFALTTDGHAYIKYGSNDTDWTRLVMQDGPTAGQYATEVGYIDFDLDTTAIRGEGRLRWNSDEGTLDLGMPGGNVNLQIGEELILRVTNDEGSQIDNGQVVYISSASGANPYVKLASNNVSANASKIIGIATENIAASQKGYVTIFGLVREIDTHLFSVGDVIYLGTSGALTNVKPSIPNLVVKVGICLRSHSSEGVIIATISMESHNDLSGLQGGTTNEYYHLSSANYTDLTDGGITSLHTHSSLLGNNDITHQANNHIFKNLAGTETGVTINTAETGDFVTLSGGTTSYTQLNLADAFNTGVNAGGYKLKITNYDNDGNTVYPIYCTDDDSLIDFYIRNKLTPSGKSLMYLQGELGVGTQTPKGQIDSVKNTSAALSFNYVASNREIAVSSSAGYGFSVGPYDHMKAAIAFEERQSNGRGDLLFLIDYNNDTTNVDISNVLARLSPDGDLFILSEGQQDAAQLSLAGSFNAGVNNGGKKLQISNYDNDSSTIYMIYCIDENSLVDFYIRNKETELGRCRMYHDGNIGIGTESPISRLTCLEANSGDLTFPIAAQNTETAVSSSTGIGFSLGSAGNIKGGIAFEEVDSNGVGRMHFLINDDLADTDVGLSDSVAYFKKDGTYILEGPVGIGTGTPGSSFEIKQSSDTSAGGVRLQSSANTNYWATYMASNILNYNYNGSILAKIYTSGSIESAAYLYTNAGAGVRITGSTIDRYIDVGSLSMSGGNTAAGSTSFAKITLSSTDGVSGTAYASYSASRHNFSDSSGNAKLLINTESSTDLVEIYAPGTTSYSQLRIGGTQNAGVNVGGYKLYITDYDNDGTTVYPIYCMDENNLVDFYVKNKPSSGGKCEVYIQGNLKIGDSSPFSDSSGTLTLQNIDALDATTIATIESSISVSSGGPVVFGKWYIYDAGTDSIGYLNPTDIASAWTTWKVAAPFDMDIEGILASADAEADGDSFTFYVTDGTTTRTTASTAMNDYDAKRILFSTALSVSAGDEIEIGTTAGNSTAEIIASLFGTTT